MASRKRLPHLLIHTDHGSSVLRPGKPRRARDPRIPTLLPFNRIETMFCQKLNNLCAPSLNVSYRTVLSSISSDLSQNGQIAGNHRTATGHSFDDRESKTFPLRRQQYERRSAVHGGQYISIELGKDENRFAECQLVYELTLVAGKFIADTYETSTWERGLHY